MSFHYFRQTVWYKLLLSLAVVTTAVCLGLIALKPSATSGALITGFVAVSLLVAHFVSQATEKVDMRLARKLNLGSLTGLHVYTKTFPAYRFVDVYRAAERFCDRDSRYVVFDTLHAEDLNAIVNSQFYGPQSGQMSQPTQVPKDVAYDRDEFFPTDRFWVRERERSEPREGMAILRVRVMEYTSEVSLEMAAFDGEAAEQTTESIIKDSIEHSIYRNQLLQISFDSGVKDEYGEMDNSGPFSLLFMPRKNVTADQIILDDDVRRILERNVFDFHRKRLELQKYGVPLKKGILFYGPPGTGKTYTCQYIYSTLENVTTLVVTGQSLLHVKTICNLARMLQPSLLVLEDVDLIFASREINLYSTALGDLMDELDGFQPDVPVTFLLTTNAINRLEQAIKDRPGRINQCVYFGPPNAKLRKLYIERYLQPYEIAGLDLDKIVTETRGTTQAFLKELIFRAVQIALEDSGRNGEMVSLQNADFSTALKEMTQFDEKATGSIMGFHVDS